MIPHRAFEVKPWGLVEETLDLDMMAQAESVFALSNGHIGMRANLEEGEPNGLPGTYLNGVYELRPLPYAEAGYGFPESGQTVINVTNGKIIRLLVDDEPYDIRYGALHSHERSLDFRSGLLRRAAEWTSPAGRTIKMSSTRLVSFTQRAVAAIAYEVEPVDGPARIVLQSELVANEEMPQHSNDPRASAVLDSPLRSESFSHTDTGATLVHRVRNSGLGVAAAMDHTVSCPAPVRIEATSEADQARTSITTVLQPGQKLRIVKLLAYGWSASRSVPALRDQVAAALTSARYGGWDGLLAEQRKFLEDFWEHSDIEVDGDPEIQQAARFAVFHVLQASVRAEQRAIPAKGLTGPGYDGHCFWDTEMYVLPLLTYSAPDAVAHALRWRQSTLGMARERAAQLGLSGAVFPWRTIHGEECSGYWPAGTAAFHIGADIAAATIRYLTATGDIEFERDTGLELLVETARMWRSLGHHDPRGRFRIDGVTGPDEYSALDDNNVYTNLMAQQNLIGAATLVERHPRHAHRLGVDDEEAASWRDAANAMYIPYDEELGVHAQSEGFTRHERWDFENTPTEHYPLLLNYPYFDIYRKQVVKQADLVLAMQLRPDAFTQEQKERNFDYYEQLTVRDSSLSACTQAVIAAEVGQLGLAFDYLGEAALMDIGDLEHNTKDGLHMASLAGACIALIEGFGGFRSYLSRFTFIPRLPDGLTRLAFTVMIRGDRMRVEVDSENATYTLRQGDHAEIEHHGQTHSIENGKPQTLPIPKLRPRERSRQPAFRSPVRRHAHDA